MKFIFIFLALALAGNCFTQSLQLDKNFNSVGKAAFRTGGGISTAMAVQPDGKILVAGRGGEDISNSGFCIVRFNQDGTVDSAFGNHGMIITIYGGSIESILVMPDGKILAAGFLGSVMIAKYLPDGTLDSSFGTNGLLQPQFNNLHYSFCYCMKLQTDGKIIITGNKDGVNALTARFLPNGNFDSGFAGIGYTVLNNGYIGLDAAIQPDGKIIIAGQGLGTKNFMLARYMPDGTLDNYFGNNGVVLTDISTMSEFLSSIALQPDGKIVAAGRYDYNSQYQNNFKTALIRYNADGSLDNTFGNNAITTLQFNTASADPKKVVIQDDGKILIAGDYTDVYSFHEPLLARYNSNGLIDEDFGDNGTYITSQFGDSLSCRSAAIQPDGKIIVAGYQLAQLDTSILYYVDSFFVLRYRGNSILPVTFAGFSVTKQQQTALLNWQTSVELNNNYFSVERSTGTDFEELGKVFAGNKQAYSFTDYNPEQGINYYRLKQVDNDGKFSYSKIISAVFDAAYSLAVYPNPASDVINLKGFNTQSSYALSITDAKGKTVAVKDMENASQCSFNIKNLSSGMYYISITSNNKTTTLKFVKQ